MAKRLVKVASELNVGIGTIVEHLNANGFSIENKPTAKVTDEMYTNLLEEFSSSVAIKEQSDQLIIGTRNKAKEKAPEVIELLKINELTSEEKPKLDGLKVVDKVDIKELKRKSVRAAVLKKINEAKNRKFKYIDLSNLDIQEIPEELKVLEILDKVILSGNRLNNAYELSKLPQGVTSLDLSNNKFEEGDVFASLLEFNLEVLNLSNNQLIYLDNSLIDLQSVSSFDFSHNDIEFFDGITFADFPKLKTLKLNNNSIEELDEGVFLSESLEHIDLSHNKISFVSPEIVSQENLTFFSVFNCPVENIPVEIFNKEGNRLDAIRDYFRSIENEENTDQLFEAKLILVGKGNVGKSTIVEALTNKKLKFKEGRNSTEGIDIKKWKIDVSKVAPEDFNSKHVKLNVWDFGGQEIYRATHQFFLTKRSVYLFIWDARSEEEYESFAYWLNIIDTLSASSPVVMVMNKADIRQKEIDEVSLKEKYKNIATFHKVSCKTGRGINDLEQLIRESVVKLDHMGDKWSQNRLKVKILLEEKKGDYIPFDNYRKLCLDEGLEDEQITHFTEQLHDLGVLMHFSENEALKDYIIINPEWATDAVYKILDDENAISKKGKLTFGDFKRIWKENKEYDNMHHELVALMTEFKLCFAASDGKSYIVPHLLSASKPKFQSFDPLNTIEQKISYDFMPAGVIECFVCDNNHLIKDELYWKHGAILNSDNSWRTEISMSPIESKNIIKLRIESSSKKERLSALAIIDNSLKKIHSKYENLGLKRLVRCNCSTTNPCFFEGHLINDYEEFGIRNVRCKKRENKYRSIPIDFLELENLKQDVIRECEELIKEGKLSTALERLDEFVQENKMSNEYLDTIAIHKNRNKGIDDHEIKGTASQEDITLKRNRLASNLLSFLRDVESMAYS